MAVRKAPKYRAIFSYDGWWYIQKRRWWGGWTKIQCTGSEAIAQQHLDAMVKPRILYPKDQEE